MTRYNKLELTWFNKDKVLVWDKRKNDYVWVEPTDISVAEARILKEKKIVGEPNSEWSPQFKRWIKSPNKIPKEEQNLLIKGDNLLGLRALEDDFAGTHVHFDANVPKKYSVLVAEIMLKSRSAKRIFAEHPGFRKRYPDGQFWSGYEHHQSIGADFEQAEAYVRSQPEHHNVKVVDDVQKQLSGFTAEADTASPNSVRA